MAMEILTTLERRFPIRRHEHVAVLYGRSGSPYRFLPFLLDGLEHLDLCCYLASPAFHQEMLNRLRARGADVDSHLRSGALRTHQGASNYGELWEWTQAAFMDAERLRVPALRWLEDGIWPKSTGIPLTEFFEFHALLNYQVKHYPSVALCQYDIAQLAVPELFSAIAVHRHLLVEDTLVRDNPFYIPAEKFIPATPEERERDLTQLFREVGFDVEKLLAVIAGYGQLQQGPRQST